MKAPYSFREINLETTMRRDMGAFLIINHQIVMTEWNCWQKNILAYSILLHEIKNLQLFAPILQALHFLIDA